MASIETKLQRNIRHLSHITRISTHYNAILDITLYVLAWSLPRIIRQISTFLFSTVEWVAFDGLCNRAIEH